MKANKQEGDEEAVIIRGGLLISSANLGKVSTREGILSRNSCCPKLFTSSECFGDETMFTDLTDIGEEWFELAADTGQIRLDRLGLDMMAHEYDEETKSVRSWFNGKGVKGAEGDVGVEGG